MKNCTLKNASSDRIISIIDHNLNALETLIDYNIANSIKLFRISSDLIPFGSSLSLNIDWQTIFSAKLKRIGGKIISSGMRVSMHPGQYTVLNSPDPLVAARTINDLKYHALVLDNLGLGTQHKIILHIGGAYGDKAKAISRFIECYNTLDYSIRKRLVIENDGSLFNIRDILDISQIIQIPVVYDNLHNTTNPSSENLSDLQWVMLCSKHWKEQDGKPKIHYSQQNLGKRTGAHSDTIDINAFIGFYSQIIDLDFDIMLEVKDKNLSAIKCINCVSHRNISMLEIEWARYKYSILEHSALLYGDIRVLLKDKSKYPVNEMYDLIKRALSIPITVGSATNAAEHVYGYFKKDATDSEKKRFMRLLSELSTGACELKSIKSFLLRLAKKYHEDYLLNGYYFYL